MRHPFVIGASIAAGMLVLIWGMRAIALRRKKAGHDDFLSDLARHTKLLLLLFPALFLGSRALTLPRDAARLIRITAVLSLIAQTALWASAAIDLWLRRRRQRLETDPSAVTTINAFRAAAVVAVWLLASVAAVDYLGFSVTTLIAGLGITGVAVALATQNILADLFASLSIVIDKPFVLGDTIQVDQHVGTVEHIGLKTTRLRSVSGEELIVSNGDLLRSRIRNMKRMTERRATARIVVASGTEVEKLERMPSLLRGAVEKQERTRFDHAHLIAFPDGGYEYELAYFVEPREFLDVQQDVMLSVARALSDEGIHLASHRNAMC